MLGFKWRQSLSRRGDYNPETIQKEHVTLRYSSYKVRNSINIRTRLASPTSPLASRLSYFSASTQTVMGIVGIVDTTVVTSLTFQPGSLVIGSWTWGHGCSIYCLFFIVVKYTKHIFHHLCNLKCLCRYIRCIECHVNAMQLSLLSSSKAFPSPLKETSCPVSSHVPFLSCPSPRQPLTWFPFNLMDLPVLDISHKWKS